MKEPYYIYKVTFFEFLSLSVEKFFLSLFIPKSSRLSKHCIMLHWLQAVDQMKIYGMNSRSLNVTQFIHYFIELIYLFGLYLVILNLYYSCIDLRFISSFSKWPSHSLAVKSDQSQKEPHESKR